MNNRHELWYVRKQGEISGPFSGSVITNHLIIGRLSLNDEISADKQHWLPVQHQTDLHPQLKQDDPDRAKRYMDERTGLDRRQAQQETPAEAKLRSGERRADEPEFETQRRELRRMLMHKYRARKEHMFWPMLATFLMLLALTMLAILYPTSLPVSLPNCSAPAAPEVNWNNCLKPELDLANIDMSRAKMRNSQLVGSNLMNATLQQADIAYADLRFANLSYSDMQNVILLGANLTQADLSYADLSNADLSYADLSNAKLGGSKLDNTRFDHAIWMNGQLCAPGSVGVCVPFVK